MNILKWFKNDDSYNYLPNYHTIKIDDIKLVINIIELPETSYEFINTTDFIGSTDDYKNSKDLTSFKPCTIPYSYDKVYRIECNKIKFYVSDNFKSSKYFNDEFITKVIIKRLSRMI